MMLVIDYSVLEHASTKGGQECLQCMKNILENENIKIVSHSKWAESVNSISLISNAVQEWKAAMFNRCTHTHDNKILEKNAEGVVETIDRNSLYLLSMSHQADKIVIYCHFFSATCDRYSQINHSLFSSIKWLSVHENKDIFQWLASCK